MKNIRRGKIFYVDFHSSIGSEQGGQRPALILQNNQGNGTSPTTIVAPLTKASNNKHKLPTHYLIKKNNFLKYDSIVLLEQIRVVDKKRVLNYLGEIDYNTRIKIDRLLIKTLNIRRGNNNDNRKSKNRKRRRLRNFSSRNNKNKNNDSKCKK